MCYKICRWFFYVYGWCYLVLDEFGFVFIYVIVGKIIIMFYDEIVGISVVYILIKYI